MERFDHGAPFWADDDGAVTVDWVVLSAAALGLGLMIVPVLNAGIHDSVDGLAATLDQAMTDAAGN